MLENQYKIFKPIILLILIFSIINCDNVWVNGTWCDQGLSHCTRCTDNNYCDGCNDIRYALNSNRDCQLCSNFQYMDYCSQCTTSSICTKCISNLYAINSTNKCRSCNLLMVNCTTCSSMTVCISCINNQSAINSTNRCQLCSVLMVGCSNCLNSTHCLNCFNNSYYLEVTTSQCNLCNTSLAECATCSSKTVCLTCKTNNFSINITINQCQLCSSLIIACNTCSNSTYCLSCQNNSYYSDSTGVCRICNYSLPFCSTCFNGTACSSCYGNTTILNSSNFCMNCSNFLVGCVTCSSNITCTSCANNSYYLNASTNKCDLCEILLSNCSTCLSNLICLSCKTNQTAVNSTSKFCTLCSTLLNNCLTCSSDKICLSCQNTSYLNATSNICEICQLSLAGCIICNNSSYCLSCNNYSYINTTSNNCLLCNNSLANCFTCSSDTVCLSCLISPNIILNNITCQLCSNLIANCLNCTTPIKCTVCDSAYVVNTTSSTCALCSTVIFGCHICTSNSSCIKCSFGWQVSNGCTNILGCIQVIQRLPLSSVCSLCDSNQFYILPKNGICLCKIGHLAGLFCTTIPGCTWINEKLTKYQCSTCNASDNFLLSNKTCICKQFYYLSGQRCLEICGDGRLFNLACDDGNTIDGDGCSSSCKVEDSYSCRNGSNSSPSQCIFGGRVSLSLSCIYRVGLSNSASMIFKIVPNIPNFYKSNLTNRISLFTKANVSISSYSLQNNELNIFVRFAEDIDGINATVNLNFDTNYIVSPSTSLQFNFNQCNNNRLVFDPDPNSTFTFVLQSGSKLASIATLICWFLGSYSHKMIGIQTLHAIQLIFFAQSFAEHYYPTVRTFRYLDRSTNIYSLMLTKKNSSSVLPYGRASFTTDLAYSLSSILILQISVILLFSIVKFIIKILKKRNPSRKNLQKSRNKKELQLLQSIYRFLICPSFLSFFLTFVIGLLINSDRAISKNISLNIEVIIILFVQFVTLYVFSQIWRQYIHYSSSQSHRPRYVLIYFSYQLSISVILSICYLSLVPFPLFLIITAQVIYLIVLFFYKPYKSKVHNFVLIFNQIGIIFSTAWLISQKFIIFTRSTEQLIALAVLALIYLILGFALLRTILELRSCNSMINILLRPIQKEMFHKPIKNENLPQKSARKQSIGLGSYMITSQLLRAKEIELQEIDTAEKILERMQLKRQILRNLRNNNEDLFS